MTVYCTAPLWTECHHRVWQNPSKALVLMVAPRIPFLGTASGAMKTILSKKGPYTRCRKGLVDLAISGKLLFTTSTILCRCRRSACLHFALQGGTALLCFPPLCIPPNCLAALCHPVAAASWMLVLALAPISESVTCWPLLCAVHLRRSKGTLSHTNVSRQLLSLAWSCTRAQERKRAGESPLDEAERKALLQGRIEAVCVHVPNLEMYCFEGGRAHEAISEQCARLAWLLRMVGYVPHGMNGPLKKAILKGGQRNALSLHFYPISRPSESIELTTSGLNAATCRYGWLTLAMAWMQSREEDAERTAAVTAMNCSPKPGNSRTQVQKPEVTSSRNAEGTSARVRMHLIAQAMGTCPS